VTLSSTTAAVTAKAATSTIPIFFLIADPPVELGLVTSLNRPGGNATGISTLAAELAAKRFSLLRQFMPQATSISALLKPSHPSAKAVTASLQQTARTLGVAVEILEASTDPEIEAAYDRLKPESGGLMSYGTIITDLWRQAGGSVARILKGEKPANLPVTQPTRFELVLNVNAAKTLGLDIPPNLLATADEVIE
jgi:putative ABC transport system substrate-binding protein